MRRGGSVAVKSHQHHVAGVSETEEVSATRKKAAAARQASRLLLATDGEARREALEAMATALEQNRGAIEGANRADLQRGQEEGLTRSLLDRLVLDGAKLATVVDGLRQLATMPDPVGKTVSSTRLDDHLDLYKVTCPLGVIACIFESRPDVVVQIAGLAVKSGNAVLLKGGKEATETNAALVQIIKEALASTRVTPHAVGHLEDREQVQELLAMDDLVDLVIPRGSSRLVRHVMDNTRIPVLGHAEGVCHIYIDKDADPDKAVHVVMDAKLDYPAACNAVETILVHKDALGLLVGLANRLQQSGVHLKGDRRGREAVPGMRRATRSDHGHEWGGPTLTVKTVDDLQQAIDHIHTYGSGHTDAIVTEDHGAMLAFVQQLDSAGVFVNASTRFADGYRYGLGAEVGISTGRIHARGPVGVEGLLSHRWVLVGDGQAASDYKERPFLHEQRDNTLATQLESWRLG